MANPRVPYRFSNDGPRLAPHSEGAIMVHLVVNVEHWQFDAGMPRTDPFAGPTDRNGRPDTTSCARGPLRGFQQA